jgi:formylglycine-generating enzyme required for sulfatase activity
VPDAEVQEAIRLMQQPVPPPTAEAPQEFTNSIGMKFKFISAGETVFGSAESPEEIAQAFDFAPARYYANEKPQQAVQIENAFYIGVTEVTQSQFELVMGWNPSDMAATGQGRLNVEGIDTSEFPVENVTWEEAAVFCKRLSQKEGLHYRLPTEVQWEHSCRAGNTTRYHFGDDPGLLGQYAWYDNNSQFRTHPVGSKQPNPFGLYDMHGNVEEWCLDLATEDDYRKAPRNDLTIPDQITARQFRGGGWNAHAAYCRCARRCWMGAEIGDSFLGFRVVLACAPPQHTPRNAPGQGTTDE